MVFIFCVNRRDYTAFAPLEQQMQQRMVLADARSGQMGFTSIQTGAFAQFVIEHQEIGSNE